MPSYFSEGDAATPGSTEVRSLQKIASLCATWATRLNASPSLPWLGGVSPKPGDTEVPLLQRINASLLAISKV